MVKLISVVLQEGDGSSYAKYFPSEQEANAYVDKYEGDEYGGLPQEVSVDTFDVEDGILIPFGGFE